MSGLTPGLRPAREQARVAAAQAAIMIIMIMISVAQSRRAQAAGRCDRPQAKLKQNS